MFRHLNPAVPYQAHIEDDMTVFVPPLALNRPAFGIFVFRQLQKPRLANQFDITVEAKTGAQAVMDVQHVHPEP